MKAMYSMRSPAVKRLMKEAQELREPTELYHTQPLEDNLFEWHFTIRGPENSDFDGGIYHGRIILPAEYPMKPPNVILLTPNGRFETNKKICLSISGHHPESWQPSWSIRTALLAIIGFMPTHGGGAIGSLDYPTEDRKKLARRSVEWKCEHCGNISTILKPLTEASKAANEEAKELATQINFRGEKSASESKPTTESETSSTNSTPITTPPNTPISNNQTFPGMPGQFPFPSFPFPPQFANMPNFTQTQQGSNAVPRFPFPPQFSPSMFAQMRMQFGQPFPFINQNARIQNSVPASQVGGNSGIGVSSANISPVLTSQTETSSDVGTSNVSSSADKGTGSSSSSSSDSDRTSTNPIETIRSENDNNPSTNQTDTSEGLRQRNVYSANTSSEPPRSFVEQYAEHLADLEPEPEQSGIRFSTVLIVLLLIGIALLVLRRAYIQRMWRLPF